METKFYCGYLFQVSYQPQLSNHDYTQHRVYLIRTNCPHEDITIEAINSIMDDDSISEEEYHAQYKENPSFANYLKHYHKIEKKADEYMNTYLYTLVIPYDD